MKCCVSTDVGTWTNWLAFEPDPDYSPDAGTGLLSPLSYKRWYTEFYVGKIRRIRIGRCSDAWFYNGFIHWASEPSKHLCRRYMRYAECPSSLLVQRMAWLRTIQGHACSSPSSAIQLSTSRRPSPRALSACLVLIPTRLTSPRCRRHWPVDTSLSSRAFIVISDGGSLTSGHRQVYIRTSHTPATLLSSYLLQLLQLLLLLLLPERSELTL